MTNARHHRGRRITLGVAAATAGLLAATVVAILAVGGIFIPATYLEPWNRAYHERFDDPRMQVVALALLAPSGHNLQPWLVELDQGDENVLRLFADPTRLAPAIDPLARQTMVSQGAFLSYLSAGAAELDLAATVEMFPEGDYDETELDASMAAIPVARITLSGDAGAPTLDTGALFLSDTNRAPYSSTPLSAAQVTELSDLGSSGGSSGPSIQLLTEKADLTSLGDYAVEGTLIESEFSAATKESDALFSGTEQAKNETRSGFAVEGQGTSGFMKYVLQGMITLVPALNDDAAAAKNAIALTADAVDHTAAYALITTPSNSRRDQVDAGILYGRESLRTRTLGLVMQPLSQVLQEYPAMADPYKSIHAEYAQEGQTIQMMLRIGSPTAEYPVTMRRDAKALVRAD